MPENEIVTPLVVDGALYHSSGTNGTKRQYRQIKRKAGNGQEAKKQRRNETVAQRLNVTTAILDFYEKKSSRVKTCCTKNNCLVNLMGHADEQGHMSPGQLVMKDRFIREVCASRYDYIYVLMSFLSHMSLL